MIPAGALPKSIVRTTSLVVGSIRETVPSPELATQTALLPTATATGSSPTRMPKAEFVLESMRETASSHRPDRAFLERDRVETLHGGVSGIGDPYETAVQRTAVWDGARVRRTGPAHRCGPDPGAAPLPEKPRERDFRSPSRVRQVELLPNSCAIEGVRIR